MLVFRRLRQVARLFSSKEPEILKQQFNKVRQLHEGKYPLFEGKLESPTLPKDDLQAKFAKLADELRQQTGEPKSFAQRLKETYNREDSTEIPKVQNYNREESFNHESKTTEEEYSSDDIDDKPSDGETQQQFTVKKLSLAEKYPKLAPLYSISSKCSEYIVESIMETFPSKERKENKKLLAYKARIKAEENQRKMDSGEFDDAIPEWKRGALQVVEEKKSTWRILKEKLANTALGSRTNSLAGKLSKAKPIVVAKEAVSDIKEGYQSVKDSLNDRIDASESVLVHTTRDALSNISKETEQAKAVRILNEITEDFDFNLFEKELEKMFMKLCLQAALGNEEYLNAVCSTSVKLIISEFTANTLMGAPIKFGKSVFLGCNTEDKSCPKLSYSIDFNVVGEKKRNEKIFLTLTPHPDPNLEISDHFWKFTEITRKKAQKVIGESKDSKSKEKKEES